jgi:hypothetical protein
MDTFSLTTDNYIAISSVVISLFSLSLVIWNNAKKTRSDQFKIAMDMNYRIEDLDNKLGAVIAKYNNSTKSEVDLTSFRTEYDDLSMEKLNTMKFLAMLINKHEITNKNIIKHFKPTFIEDSDYLFKEYPKLEKDENKYEELKNLLNRLGDHKFRD